MYKIILFLLSLVLVTACGVDSGHFKIDGRLLNLNQGEFIVYSPDGAMPHADTIHVEGGRFELITECVHEGTALIIMPNGMEMPLFVRPGLSLSLRGDAQNLRMAEVTGSDDNEVMNEFRKQVNGKPDNALAPFIKDAITQHPESAVGLYLIRRYMLSVPRPDYPAILQLLGVMKNSQKDNTAVAVMHRQVMEMQKVAAGSRVPTFSVTDINGKALRHSDLSQGIAVVAFFATWDYESLQQVRNIHSTIDKGSSSVPTKVLAVSVDASSDAVKGSVGMDKDHWTIICDGKQTDGTLPKAFAVTQTGTVILIRDGRILDRSLCGEPLYDKLRELLK